MLQFNQSFFHLINVEIIYFYKLYGHAWCRKPYVCFQWNKLEPSERSFQWWPYLSTSTLAYVSSSGKDPDRKCRVIKHDLRIVRCHGHKQAYDKFIRHTLISCYRTSTDHHQPLAQKLLSLALSTIPYTTGSSNSASFAGSLEKFHAFPTKLTCWPLHNQDDLYHWRNAYDDSYRGCVPKYITFLESGTQPTTPNHIVLSEFSSLSL